MPCLDRFSSLVSFAYQAAAEPHLWPEFLAALSEVMEAPHIYFLGESTVQPAARVLHLHGYSDSEVRRYVDHYHKADMLLDAISQSASATGFWDAELDGDLAARYRRSEIFHDYAGPIGLAKQTCISAAHSGPFDLIGTGLWRPQSARSYSAEERHFLRLLFPHITQALHLHARLTALQTETALFRSGVEAAGTALLALDHAGRILSTSAAARSLLQPAPGSCLSAEGGRLRASYAPADRALQRLIAGTLAAATLQHADHPLTAFGNKTPGGSLLLPRLDGSRPICLQITPFHAGTIPTHHPIAALVFLTDPDTKPPSREHLLRDLFELTPTEARLADLVVQGLELREAGDQLRLSYDSARFHLKQVFRKSGTRRQTDLIRLAGSLPTL